MQRFKVLFLIVAALSAAIANAAEPRLDSRAFDFRSATPAAVLEDGRFSAQDGLAAIGRKRARLVSNAIAAPAPFRAVGANFVMNGELDDVTIRARVSWDGARWSEWWPLSRADDMPAGEGRYSTNLATFDEAARFAQFEVIVKAGTSVRELTLSFIDPGTAPAVEFDSEAQAVSSPKVVSRTDWGCPDKQDSPKWKPRLQTKITHLVVHHTATRNDAKDWPAEVRTIWKWHSSDRGWFDVGYNFLIDPKGVIYEGRAGGPTSEGAHFSCVNGGTVGVSMLGTYSSSNITAEARRSLVQLLGWLAEQNKIDPKAVAYHSVSALQLSTVAGHRDANASPNRCRDASTGKLTSTECPGDTLYGSLAALRQDVWSAMGGGAANDTTKPWFTSFNAGPSTLQVGAPVSISYTAADAGGSGLARVELWRAPEVNGTRGTWVQLQTHNVSGNGPVSRTFTDTPPAGVWFYGAHALDARGNMGVEPAPVRVQVRFADTTKPQFRSFRVTPASTTSGNTITITFEASDAQSGINRVELWRAPDAGGRPGAWIELARRSFNNASNASGSWSDRPPIGKWWYGVHAIDGANNMGVEPHPPGPIFVEVRAAVDRTKPEFRAFSVSPASLRAGQWTTITFQAYDGQSGISRVELWRAPDVNGRPGAWTEVARRSYNGAANASGTFDWRPPAGKWWIGVHAVDVQGNVGVEPAPGPKLITVR